MAATFYIPVNNVQVFHFLRILISACYFLIFFSFSNKAVLIGVKPCLTVVLICICCWDIQVLYLFWILIPYQMWLQLFCPFLLVIFSLSCLIDAQYLFNFDEVQLILFFCFFWCHIQKVIARFNMVYKYIVDILCYISFQYATQCFASYPHY